MKTFIPGVTTRFKKKNHKDNDSGRHRSPLDPGGDYVRHRTSE